jgi:hypothetical protein
VLHVHSYLGGHTKGTLEDIETAARANQLDFVVMTEHAESDIDTSDLTLKGNRNGIVFVNGNEISTNNGDRLLILPGEKSLGNAGRHSTAEVAAETRSKHSLSLVAYPKDYKSWQVNELDGLEVYNTYTNAKEINPLVTFFDVIWSQWSYPDLQFANFYERPDNGLSLWDQALRSRRLTAVAGNDAHSNIGFNLVDRNGRKIVGIRLDPYEVSFRLVRMHVLVREDAALSQEQILEALKQGRCFIGFDVFGDSSGFSFTAESSGEMKLQGEEVSLVNGVSLRIGSPVKAKLRLLKDGALFQEVSGVDDLLVPVTTRGVYRVEVYLSQLGKFGEQPWIISNPIYVR